MTSHSMKSIDKWHRYGNFIACGSGLKDEHLNLDFTPIAAGKSKGNVNILFASWLFVMLLFLIGFLVSIEIQLVILWYVQKINHTRSSFSSGTCEF